MGKYSAEPDNATKAAKAKGSNLRCHFKNTRETAQAIKKMPLHRATTYLKNVLAKTEIIPFRRFMGGKYFIFEFYFIKKQDFFYVLKYYKQEKVKSAVCFY